MASGNSQGNVKQTIYCAIAFASLAWAGCIGDESQIRNDSLLLHFHEGACQSARLLLAELVAAQCRWVDSGSAYANASSLAGPLANRETGTGGAGADAAALRAATCCVAEMVLAVAAASTTPAEMTGLGRFKDQYDDDDGGSCWLNRALLCLQVGASAPLCSWWRRRNSQ